MSPCHAIFYQVYKILACIWVLLLCEKLEYFVHLSPRGILYFKVGNLGFLILSSYVKSLKPGMSLVARLWAFTITSTWRLNLGAQTELAYSKCGLTNALYRRRKDSSSRCMNDLLIRPTIPFTLSILSDICWSKIRSRFIVTARSFSWSTTSNWCCLSV